MSLHALANHLQSAGRGSDKVLVHMTPGEVKGLQSLAMAHGGSLTVNPETGLPEAGFLSSILPMIAGFALNAFLPGVGTAIGSALGTSSAVGTGILVGGATGIAKGSLKEGIMAGLGAYGGAGMAEGLSAVGAANAPSVKIDPIVDGMDDIYGSYGPGSYTGNFSGTQIQNAGINATGPVSSTGGFNSLNLSQNPIVDASKFDPKAYGIAAPTTTAPAASVQMPTASEVYSKGLVNPPVEVAPLPISGTPSTALDITGGVPKEYAGQNWTTSTYGNPQATPGFEVKTIYEGSSTPYPYTSEAARIQNDPLMEAVSAPKNTSMGMKVPTPTDNITGGLRHIKDTGFQGVKDVWNATPTGTGLGLAATGMSVMQSQQEEEAAAARAAADAAAAERRGYIRPYEFSTSLTENAFAPRASTSENRYFVEPRFTAKDVYKVKEGGLTSLAVGGPVEQMAAQNAMGSNTMYPQSQLQTAMYANPMVQRPVPNDVITSGIDAPTDRYTGEMRMAAGGISSLGGYSDGGSLLRGPGDGVSDSIPAQIGDKQPARLADGEFVIPARIVSEIGNGSTEAGARKLYAMMNRVQHARKKTVGKDQVAKNTKAERLLPA